MAVRDLKISSMRKISEKSPFDLKIRKFPIAEIDESSISLLRTSVDNHFDYAEELTAYRKEFEERKSKIKPSPKIKPLDFEQMPVLGTGKFGTVRLMKMKNGQVCALKILSKENVVREKVVDKTLMEKIILSAAHFPFVISLIFSSKDNDYLYIGLPFAGGSDLFTYHRKRSRFTESVARFYAAQILLALEYLHNVKCLYRDLKLENVLIETNGYLKLTDFGLAKFVEGRTTTLCGTPEYLAPEMILVQPYGFSIDWWTFGILLYELVAGHTPFYKFSDNPNRMYGKICKGEYDIPQTFSPELKSLIQGLLDLRVATRLGNLCNGIKDIKNHKFFRVTQWRAIIEQHIPAPFRPRLLHSADTSYFVKTGSDLQTNFKRSEIDLYAEIFADF